MSYIAKLKQGGIIVAEVDAPTEEQAIREIQHYAMLYCQDGEVEIIKEWEHTDNNRTKANEVGK